MIKKDGERVRFANSLRKDLYEKLQQRSKDTDIPLSKLLDRAVELYFVINVSNQKENNGEYVRNENGYIQITKIEDNKKEPSEG